jgi:sugar-specific transcriptional regulator TrmB
LIDRIRRDIQARLEQLQAEAEKLGRALAALDPRQKPAPARRAQKPAATTRKPAASSKQTASGRNTSGRTKAKVLAALSTDVGMTASEVAKATGLGRGSVSTTLS